jgi:hypothetical protein
MFCSRAPAASPTEPSLMRGPAYACCTSPRFRGGWNQSVGHTWLLLEAASECATREGVDCRKQLAARHQEKLVNELPDLLRVHSLQYVTAPPLSPALPLKLAAVASPLARRDGQTAGVDARSTPGAHARRRRLTAGSRRGVAFGSVSQRMLSEQLAQQQRQKMRKLRSIFPLRLVPAAADGHGHTSQPRRV